MKKRFLLVIIFCILIISFITGFFILNYLDPYLSPVLGISLLAITFSMLVSSFFTLIFYFIKKIHYRGEVYIRHVLSSFRQGFFISLFILGLIIFKIIGVSLNLAGSLLFISIFLIEMFIQNLKIED